jgi:HAMP domain-containing protein
MRLVARLAIALAVGLVITAVFAWYLSGRITRPVRRLAKAADEVAEGHYDTNVPEVPGRDEIADLADSFRQMTERLAEAEELERNFLMTVSHELRTPLRPSRPRRVMREGLVEIGDSLAGRDRPEAGQLGDSWGRPRPRKLDTPSRSA